MDKITLHGFAPSTYTRTARMAAIEKGIACELVPVAFGKPEHVALHPFGKLPIMTDGHVTLYETLAIVAYLDGKIGAPSLFGVGMVEKAMVLAAASVAIDYAYRDVIRIETQSGELSMDQISAATRVFDWMEGRLTQTRHLASEELSAADLFFAPMLAYHAQQFGERNIYTDRAHLNAWMTAIARRPSFKKTAG